MRKRLTSLLVLPLLFVAKTGAEAVDSTAYASPCVSDAATTAVADHGPEATARSASFADTRFAENGRTGAGAWPLPPAAGETDGAEAEPDDTAAAAAARKRTWAGRVVDYFLNSDKHSGKNFNFGILPGPHFSSTVGLGLGLVATGLYSLDRSDPALPQSNAALYADMTTKGFLLIGLKGNNIFRKERYRLDYRLYTYTFPTRFWGMGYGNGRNDDNETDYRRFRFDAMARFLVQVKGKLYVGPLVSYRFIRASEIEGQGLPLFEGQERTLRSLEAGLSLTYDSRDFMLNAYRGWFVQLDQTFAPRWVAGDYNYAKTDLTVSTYRQVWKGGVLAGEWHSAFIDGTPGWGMMSEAGASGRLRGYYEGRYRDRNIMEAQVELRQHVWKRNGVALWLGAGEVFPKFGELRWKRVLPNAGAGYRWAFKHRVNVRLDCGFSRDGCGFMFNINEAF